MIVGPEGAIAAMVGAALIPMTSDPSQLIESLRKEDITFIFARLKSPMLEHLGPGW